LLAKRAWSYCRVMNPLQVLRDSIREVPAIKYALGVAGIAGSVALILAFGLDLRTAAIGTVVMMLLMATLVVFVRLATIRRSRLTAPALVLMWASVILVVTFAVLLLTGVFFQWPLRLAPWLSSGLNSHRVESVIDSAGSAFSKATATQTAGYFTLSPYRDFWVGDGDIKTDARYAGDTVTSFAGAYSGSYVTNYVIGDLRVDIPGVDENAEVRFALKVSQEGSGKGSVVITDASERGVVLFTQVSAASRELLLNNQRSYIVEVSSQVRADEDSNAEHWISATFRYIL
jgi:hypothetical protein